MHPMFASCRTLQAPKIAADVKQRALANVFKPASAIVDEIILEQFHVRVPLPALQKPEYLAWGPGDFAPRDIALPGERPLGIWLPSPGGQIPRNLVLPSERPFRDLAPPPTRQCSYLKIIFLYLTQLPRLLLKYGLAI